MTAAPKKLAASVKARLQNEAARRGDDFNLLLLRYGIERLLFRLSQSAYADRFLLKGAMLFVVWDEKTHRPTRDLDLLGFGPSEKQDLQKLFQEVVTLPVVDDGLVFDPASVRAEEIREDNTYGGVRVRIMAKLGPAEVPVQIDVGVGDAVTPAPEMAIFPALLDFPAPQVRTYPVYTVVAEKFEAMAKLGIANTRMAPASAPSAADERLLVTQKRAAELLSVSRVTIWRMTRELILHPVEIIPGTWRYSFREIMALASTGTECGEQSAKSAA